MLWEGKPKNGHYNVKLGYCLHNLENTIDSLWWWKLLWQVQAPPKSKFLVNTEKVNPYLGHVKEKWFDGAKKMKSMWGVRVIYNSLISPLSFHQGNLA